MVPNSLQLPVGCTELGQIVAESCVRFPLEIVYRIYDNILASGVEAIFAFSLVLLYKNEQTLLGLKFDEILVFINTRIFEVYEVCPLLLARHAAAVEHSRSPPRTPRQIRRRTRLRNT
jgi:hypothetical protein